jgi:hypothetical protein
MWASAAITSIGLVGPYLIAIERTGDSWRIAMILRNGATILGQQFLYVVLGALLLGAAVYWGRGARHAGWLKLSIGLSVVIMTTLGLAALLEAVLLVFGGGAGIPEVQFHVVWTYLLAYPAALVAFVVNLRYGTRRA